MAREGGYDVGTAFLTVVPSFKGVEAALAKGARQIADGLNNAISDALPDGVKEGAARAEREARTAGDRSGEAFAGHFADNLRRRLQAAIKALPDIELKPAANATEQTIKDLRGQLAELQDQHIGVDIDEATALAAIAAIKAQLVDLAKTDPSIRVHADAVAAATELGATEKLAERLDGKTVDIKVNADSGGLNDLANSTQFSLSRLESLVAVSLSLGTVLVPAAAAAAGAIGFIGTSAVSAAAGVGVLALGFSGIGPAVKAMQAYSEDAAKSSSSLARSQSQVASAADAVSSAERSLSNTRANNADAARRAARQVADAETAVARAKEDAKRAELDLTRAREAARRALEDMAFDLEELDIAQRKATLDQIQAQRDLEKLTNNPRATEEQRKQAQATYDGITLRIRELAVQQQRLSADQKAAAKAGVEGSKQVEAAQEQVRAKSEAVAAAQRRVGDAVMAQQAQQRQAAFAVAQAQQSLAAAHRQVESASVRAGTAGGEALDNLNTVMAKLTPTGQRFARFIFGLKDELLGIRAAASDNLLPGVQSSIEHLIPLLPGFQGYIGRVAHSIGDMFVETSRFLRVDPTWRRFFSHVDTETVPTLERLYRIARNVVTGTTGLYLAFTPFNGDIGGGLERLTQRFAKWSAELESNPGFQKFLAYVRENGPPVVDLIEQATEFVGRFIVASAPVGSFLVGAFDKLFQLLNGIPMPVLQGIAISIAAISAAIVTVNTATRLWTLTTGAIGSVRDAYTNVKNAATAAFDNTGAAMDRARDRSDRFDKAVGRTKLTVLTARDGLANLGSFLAGPWGVALGAATLAVGYFAQKSAEQKQKVDDLAAALMLLGKAYKETRSVSSQAVKDIVAQSKELQALVNNANKYGVAVESIARAASGEKTAQDQVIRSLIAKRDALAALDIAQSAAGAESGLISTQHAEEVKAIDTTVSALRSQFGALNEATSAQNALDAAQQKITGSAPLAAESQAALAAAVKVLADETSTAADKANALKRAQDALTGAARSQTEAEEAYQAAVDNVAGALTRKNNSLDLNTAAGRANRDAVQALLDASVEMYNTDIAAGVGVDEATRRHEARVKALKDEADKAGANKIETEKLIATYGKVPGTVETLLKMVGYEGVDKLLKELAIKQAQLNHPGMSLAESKRLYEKDEKLAKLAGGGPVAGPGTGTSDDVLLWGSDGEFMQPTASVDYYGPSFMEAIRRRAIPKGMLPGFAQGGLVQRWPFDVDVSKTFIPALDESPSGAGAPSTGGIGSGDMMAILRRVFPGLALYSGFRPGSRTASGSLSYHAMLAADGDKGRAVDVPPRADVFNYIHDHFMAQTRELIWLGDKWRNIWNGRHHKFNDTLLSQHGVAGMPNAHVHWAYDSGGMLPPGVSTVFNGTGKPEPVLTDGQWQQLTERARGGDDGPREVHNWYFKDTVLDEGRLQAWQDRRDALSRIGRPG